MPEIVKIQPVIDKTTKINKNDKLTQKMQSNWMAYIDKLLPHWKNPKNRQNEIFLNGRNEPNWSNQQNLKNTYLSMKIDKTAEIELRQ